MNGYQKMKNLFWASLALSTVFYVGCGGGDKPVADVPPQVSTGSQSQLVSTGNAPTSAMPSHAAVPSDPKEIVRVFLEAMRKGDGQQLAALFTDAARREIERQGIAIEPPGSAQATFTIGDATMEDGEVLVSSTWLEPEVEGQPPQTMEVVWVLHKDVPGWRIAGMVVATGPSEDDIEIVNFENLDEPTAEQPLPPQERVANLPGAPNGGSVSGLPSLPPAGDFPPEGLPPTGGLPRFNFDNTDK
jgi:hypothetical protein